MENFKMYRRIYLIFSFISILIFSTTASAYSLGGGGCYNLCQAKFHYCSSTEYEEQDNMLSSCEDGCFSRNQDCRYDIHKQVYSCQAHCRERLHNNFGTGRYSIADLQCEANCKRNLRNSLKTCNAGTVACSNQCSQSSFSVSYNCPGSFNSCISDCDSRPQICFSHNDCGRDEGCYRGKCIAQ